MLVELSPAAWMALRALVEEALDEPSDASGLLRQTLRELDQVSGPFSPLAAPGSNSDSQWN